MASPPSDNSPLYCICRQPYDPGLFMIECDACKDWFHGKCIEIKEYQACDIEIYHCPSCQLTHGPLQLKHRLNWHRHDYSEEDSSKAVQTGTVVFIRELKTRTFCSCDEIPVLHLPASALTIDHFIAQSFSTPIIVDKKEGLGLTVPPATFTVNDVESYVGSMRELDVIDVLRQEDCKMVMREWTEYYNRPNRNKIYNVISLEFSSTRLSELVVVPKIVRQLSWANTVWPSELPEDCCYTKPLVQKYCLMGVKDSYTDFHIDFGGSSVWYHVLRGEKVFFLIPPSPTNLALYEAWLTSHNRSETFLGDRVDKCHKCVVKQGQTIFLPSGWIHAVFTPIDTLVFGGNFIHDFNIDLQIQIYELERRVKTEEKFMFPCFETSHWYKAKIILDYIKDCNDTQKLPHRHMLEGGKAIAAALKSWTKRKDFVKNAKYEVPEHISYSKLLKDLNRELQLYDAVSPESSPKRTNRPKRKKDESRQQDFEKLTNLKKQTEKEILKLQKQRSKLKGHRKRNKKRTLKVELSHSASSRDGTSDASPEKKATISNSPAAITRLKLRVSKGKIVSDNLNDTSSPEKNAKTKTKSQSTTTLQESLKLKIAKEKRTKSKRTKKYDQAVILDKFVDIESENVENEANESDGNSPVGDGKARTKPLPRSSPVKSGSLKLRLSFHGHTRENEAKSSAVRSERRAKGRKKTARSPVKRKHSVSEAGDVHVARTIRGGLNGSISDILEASGYGTEQDISPDSKSEIKTGIMSAIKSEIKTGIVSDIKPEIKTGIVSDIKSEIKTGITSDMKPEIKGIVGRHDEYVASPGTCDAIQGMLSMRNSTDNSGGARQPPRDVYAFDDEEEKIQQCYKDDDFFYPSLEISDDEGNPSHARQRDMDDSTWNPRAVVNTSQSVSRHKLPRDGARRESVGTSLAVTAAKLHDVSGEPVLKKKRPYVKKKRKVDKVKERVLPLVDPAMVASSSMMPPSTEQLEAQLKQHLSPPISPVKAKRPKKGFATAKQRLGKILKIHKMTF